MKRLLMLILCLLLLVAIAVPALAAGTVQMVTNKTSVYRDSEFTVTVVVSGWGACTTGSAVVIPGASFELKGGEWMVSSPDISYFSPGDRDGGFAYNQSKDISGNLLRLTLKVKSNAAFAYDKVKVELNLGGVKTVQEISILVACNHSFSNWTNLGASGHTRKCNICGREEPGAHGYDNACDTTCNSCGAVRETTHDFTGPWEGDETGHWHACQVCGVKDDIAEHIPGKEAGEYEDQVCVDCGYILVPALGHTHKYDDRYNTGEHGHWQTCVGCGEANEVLEHEYDHACDANCNICDYQRQVTHQSGSWAYNEIEHWKPCSVCQEPQEQGQHQWDAGFVKAAPTDTEEGLRVYHCVSCMAERTETIPMATIAAPIAGLTWWMWLAGGAGCGVILTCLVWIIVIACAKGKRKGKFS
jgi:hypothetical protein